MNLKHVVKPVSIFLIALALVLIPSIHVPILDDNADAYFTSSIDKALAAYVTCRIINSAVSVVKESNFHIDIFAGATLAAGEVVDPIYDLTERANDVFITAIASLTIQELVFKISKEFAHRIIGLLLIISMACALVNKPWAESYILFLSKIIVVVMIARFCLPISACLNSGLNRGYFDPKIAPVEKNLSPWSDDFKKVATTQVMQDKGIIGYIQEKSAEVQELLTTFTMRAKEIAANILNLITLYISLFVIQVIVLPLLVFWVLIKTINHMFGTQIPQIIRHSDMQKLWRKSPK